MFIGIPKEIKDHEYRVGGTPNFVHALVRCGHRVVVQQGAGQQIGFYDRDYEGAGAKVVQTAEQVYEADMIIKVKEPQSSEFSLLKKGQILYCYLHLAPDPVQTKHLLEREVIGIAYETVVDNAGGLPLLTPMSEVAGRVAIQAGANALHMANGGRGVLLGGAAGVLPSRVVIIGGGVVGLQAARMAMGLGAEVIVLDRSVNRLRAIDEAFNFRIRTLYSTPEALEELLPTADLVVGAVLIPGKSAPKLITREAVRGMKDGAVIVDVAIDQGGCAETSKPTSHSDPVYIDEGVVHYCVTNMPGACARTSTQALTNATLSYALDIANKGATHALLDDAHLLPGLNVYHGKVTNEHVAADLGYTYHCPKSVLG